MSTINKKAISDHYREAVTREDLQIREAAKFLNINPCYLSMAVNERFWDSMSKAAWDRLNEWHESRGKISEFVIPQGEEIFVQKPYVPKEKKVIDKKAVVEKVDPKTNAGEENDGLMHLPDLEKKREKKKPGKQAPIVNLLFSKAEIAALDKKFSPLFTSIENILSKINSVDQDVRLQGKYISEIRSDFENLKKEAAEPVEAVLKATWHDKPAKKAKRWSIVFFQRNIYQK
jgi:hypothetical protein